MNLALHANMFMNINHPSIVNFSISSARTKKTRPNTQNIRARRNLSAWTKGQAHSLPRLAGQPLLLPSQPTQESAGKAAPVL